MNVTKKPGALTGFFRCLRDALSFARDAP